MKNFILIVLSLLLNSVLFSQEATINNCHGNNATECVVYACESSSLDLIAGTNGVTNSIDTVIWRERYSDDGGSNWTSWVVVSGADHLDTIAAPYGSVAQAGRIYEYWLRVYDDGGDEYWSFSRLNVNLSPSVTLLSSATEICAGEEVSFSASAGMSNYDFQVNAGTVQSASVDTFSTTTLNDGDVVTVIVTDANGCTATSNSIGMVVHPIPTWASIDGNSTPGCVNTMIDVTMTGLTGTAPWTFNVYDDNAGNPGSLYYVVPGSTTNSNPTVQVPVPSSGNSIMHMQIVDANGCKTFLAP